MSCSPTLPPSLRHLYATQTENSGPFHSHLSSVPYTGGQGSKTSWRCSGSDILWSERLPIKIWHHVPSQNSTTIAGVQQTRANNHGNISLRGPRPDQSSRQKWNTNPSPSLAEKRGRRIGIVFLIPCQKAEAPQTGLASPSNSVHLP